MNKIKLLKKMSLIELSASLNISKEELALACIDLGINVDENTTFGMETIELIADDLEIAIEFYDPDPNSQLNVYIETGRASKEEIAEIIADISILYRKLGGTGINFSFEGIHILKENQIEI